MNPVQVRNYNQHEIWCLIIFDTAPRGPMHHIIPSLYSQHSPSNLAWWRHQMEPFPALLGICAGNSLVPGEFPHKGQWREALMFFSICVWLNGWVNNREAGDLRHQRVHYDFIVMAIVDGGTTLYLHNYSNVSLDIYDYEQVIGTWFRIHLFIWFSDMTRQFTG